MSEYYLAHHGIKGQRWGVRRFQNEDGSYTAAGRDRYGRGSDKPSTVGVPKHSVAGIGKKQSPIGIPKHSTTKNDGNNNAKGTAKTVGKEVGKAAVNFAKGAAIGVGYTVLTTAAITGIGAIQVAKFLKDNPEVAEEVKNAIKNYGRMRV